MALTSRTGGHLLPCGRHLEDLLDRLDSAAGAPPDEHENACPHCRTARSSLQALAEATRAVYEDTSLTPSLALRERILATVRAELRRGERLPLPPGDFGPVDVSEQAVAVVLRFAADTVEGVRARRCRLHSTVGTRPTGSAEGVASVKVELSIAIRYGPDASLQLVEAVRARVSAAAAAQIGLHVSEIDITIEDVYWDGGQPTSW